MEDQESQKEKNPKKPSDKGPQDFARYTGMAFQMIGIILVTTWGGVRLDKLTGWSTPVFTIVLSLFGVFAALYVTLKGLIK